MLVLSRKKSAKIRIVVPATSRPRTIELLVVEILGDKVRIGVQADRDIAVDREEVAQAIARDGGRVFRKGTQPAVDKPAQADIP